MIIPEVFGAESYVLLTSIFEITTTLASFSKQLGYWEVLQICELCAVSTDSQKMNSVITLVAVATASTGGG